MRYSELVESEMSELDKEVEYVHDEYRPEEGDDFLAVVDLVASEQFSVDTLIAAYHKKYGNPYHKSKK